ncbi:hypothetical protein [Streptomyces sp. TP-A0874]|uniref:hypothetical protein n=1 Tax=Streptomyces sp. TP-A0874 TaxID=549819 RepID=UPI00085330A7|nr:hypothetical protein [Streptomyces sp. TP-A0874]
MRSLLCALGAVVMALLPATAQAAPAAPSPAGDPPASFTIEDPRITESSGLAASRRHPGIYWTHNDSDDGPYVYAVDSASGRTVATVTLSGIEPRDVEAISIGPDNRIYVGDIGDNLNGSWPEVWIYEFPEPEELADTTLTPTRYTVRYQDGPRDAESLVVDPKTGRAYVISKHEDGGGLYEGPKELSASKVNTFRRISEVDLWATDAALSPDGSRLVVRGYFQAAMYRWRDGRPEWLGAPGLPMQRQGESVTFTPDGRALMYGTEGERSTVTRIDLSGELLPDSARGRQGGNGAERGPAGDAAGSESEGRENRNLVLAALTFGMATAVVMGLRRLVRRR